MTTKLYTGLTFDRSTLWTLEIGPSIGGLPEELKMRRAILTEVDPETNVIMAKYERDYMAHCEDAFIQRDLLKFTGVDAMVARDRLIRPANYDRDQHWYSNGVRIAWYDRREHVWTSYLIDSKGNQRTPAEYYANRYQFEACEDQGHFDGDHATLVEAIESGRWG